MPPSSERDDTDEESDRFDSRRRTAVLLFLLVFLVVAAGAYWTGSLPFAPGPGGPSEATGDLTVTVESDADEPVSGRSVKLVEPRSGEVVATATTDQRGRVTFQNVEQQKYTVRVDGKSSDVRLTSESEQVTVEVTVTPPKSDGSSRPAEFGDMLYTQAAVAPGMVKTVELSDELAERMEDHLREDETFEEFIEELVNIYEQEGRFTDKGL